MSTKTTKSGCRECVQGRPLGFDISMAFQPIVDIRDKTVFAQEALVRGRNNESAATVFTQVNDTNRYQFDQLCRRTAIALAAKLGIEQFLSINFMPNAVYVPELCLQTTLAAAIEHNFPTSRIIFEITEGEQIVDIGHLRNIVDCYHDHGFCTALDDFGAGYSGLNLLADLHCDLLKIDMALVRDIHRDRRRQAIVRGVVNTCEALQIRLVAEGVETAEEFRFLRDLGISLFQGYLFARPTFEGLADIAWPD